MIWQHPVLYSTVKSLFYILKVCVILSRRFQPALKTVFISISPSLTFSVSLSLCFLLTSPSSDVSIVGVNRLFSNVSFFFQDVFVLLDLLGAPHPRISNTYGHGANQLFLELPKIGQFSNASSVFQSRKNKGSSDDVWTLSRYWTVCHRILVVYRGY